MWRIKELQAHPMKLFMIITACDASALYTYSISTKTCTWNLYKLFAWTTQFDDDCQSLDKALNQQVKSIAFLAIFTAIFGLWCQLCIALDLILTIHRPFTPKQSRMPFYIGVSFLIALFQSFLTLFHPFTNHTFGEVTTSEKIGGILAMVWIVSMWLVSIFSIVYGIIKLCKPGISSKVRRAIMIRHVTTIVLFNICQLYLQIGSFLFFSSKYWGDNPLPDYSDTTWVVVLKCIFAIQGLIIPFSRLTEPYFFHILTTRTKAMLIEMSCCCGLADARRKQLSQEELRNDSTFMDRDLIELKSTDSFYSTARFSEFGSDDSSYLRKASIDQDNKDADSFIVTAKVESSEKEESSSEPEKKDMAEDNLLYFELVSSLNVELVYIILKSITQFACVRAAANSSSDNAVGTSQLLRDKKKRQNAVTNFQIDQQTGDASLILDRIKVKNSEAWSNQKQTFTPEQLEQKMVKAKTVIIQTSVKVTFYRMGTFQETFKDYFANPDVLHQSLSPKYNRDMIFKAGEGAGRSGSFFFFSHDKKFIIKTMTSGELKLFLKLLPDLTEHYRKVPNSLLAKKFGVFTVKRRGVQAVHIMLMENTLRLKNPKQLKYVFDLKGSLVDRKVKGMTKATTTLKDVNFLMAAAKHRNFTKQARKNRAMLRSTIRQDVEFLRSQGLMDYSLLLGIEVNKKRSKSHQAHHFPDIGNSQVGNDSLLDDPSNYSKNSRHTQGLVPRSTLAPSSVKRSKAAVTNDGVNDEATVIDPGELMSRRHCFVNGPRIYHIAIIDYLQEWNLNKKLERFIKTVLLGKNRENLSAIKPETYGKRFKNFMEKNVML